MHRFLLFLVALGAAFSQSSGELTEKAPPEVDSALRARIAKFYQAHVDGKPRLAEEVVAPESRDIFYEARKPKYFSFEIGKIFYYDNFMKAKAVVLCETTFMAPGFAGQRVRFPIPTLWKLIDGQWYWYVDPESLNETPFGRMKADETPPSAGGAMPSFQRLAPESLLQQVKAEKPVVRLGADEKSSDRTEIVNHAPGVVHLSLEPIRAAGLEVKLDKAELKAGEKATLYIESQPDPARPASIVINVKVEPMNVLIPIQVQFTRH